MHNSISMPVPLCRVCCIDDSKTSAFVTKRLLTQQGYQVDHFANAESAIEALFEREYALIITDLMLANENALNGDDFIRLIRNCGHKDKHKIPIVVLTGASDQQVRATLKSLGANAVLTKPLEAALLNQTLQQIAPLFAPISEPLSAELVGNTGLDKIMPAPIENVDQLLGTVVKHQEKTALTNAPANEWADELPAMETAFEKIDRHDSVNLISTKRRRNFNDLTLNDMTDVQENAVSPHPSHSTKSPYDFTSLCIDDIADGVKVKEKSGFDGLTLQDLVVLPDLTHVAAIQQPSSISERIALSVPVEQNVADVVVPILTTELKLSATRSAQQSDTQDKLLRPSPQMLTKAVKKSEASVVPKAAPIVGALPSSTQPVVTSPNVETQDNSGDELSVLDKALVAALDDKISESSKTTSQHESSPAPIKTKESQEKSDNPLLSMLENLSVEDDKPQTPAASVVSSTSQTSSVWQRLFGWKVISASLLLLAMAGGIWQFVLLPQQSLVVNTAVVEQGPIHEIISVSGKVMSTKYLDLTAHETGQIVAIDVKEGDRVKKGEVLARLDDVKAVSDVNRYQAKLLSTQEEVSLTNKTRERLQRALNLGAVSRQMVEDAESAWKAASARQTEAEEEFKSAQLMLQRTKVVAQFDGLITKRYAQPGQWITPPEPILTLIDTSQLIVNLTIDVADSAKLKIGQDVMLASEAIAGRTWREEIIYLSPATTQNSIANTIDVHVSLSANAPALRVGQSVDADIRLVSNDNAVKVPFEALINDNGQPQLAIYQAGRVRIVAIKIGIEDFTHVEVIQGISLDDKVILPEGKTLEDGQKVVLVNSVV